MEKKDIRISVSKDGPYIVSGQVPIQEKIIESDKDGNSIKWKDGKKFKCDGSCALCRCGNSLTKPFCSGMHAKIGFKGDETANNIPYNKRAAVTEGKDIILKDVKELCASARFCDPDDGTWELTKKSDIPECKKLALQQACDCPSGRLVMCDKKTGKDIEPKFEKSIGVVEDPSRKASGPLWIRGGIQVESASGKEYEVRNRMTLCRCGKSKNKPFCDGSHLVEEFETKE